MASHKYVDNDIEKWTEQQTGEYVKRAIAEMQSFETPIARYEKLRDCVLHAKERCPESKRPWLDKLLEQGKQEIAQALRTDFAAGSQSTTCE